MRIVVTGSLGHISKPLTKILIQQGHSVVVCSSKDSRCQEIEAMGAKAAIGTMMDPSFLTATFRDADIVYAMEAHAAGTFFDHELDLIASNVEIGENYKTAIRNAGVKKVIHLSSIGAHMAEGNGILKFHYLVENILRELPDDVAIKFMRPVGFYYNMFAFIPTIKKRGAIVQNYGGDATEPWVAPADIAVAIASEMGKPFKGREIHYVASDELSPNQIARTLGNAVGNIELKWLTISDDEMLSGLLSAGMNPQTAAGVVEMNAARRGGKLYEDFYQNLPEYGEVKFDDFAKDFVEVYQQD